MDINEIAALSGMVHMRDAYGFTDEWQVYESQRDARVALDAVTNDSQPTAITTANTGIPTFLTTYLDPTIIRVLLQPRKATVFAGGEVKKGDWTSTSAVFKLVDQTGSISAYGDHSESGEANININWPNRQPFHFQTIIQYGEKELANASAGGVSLASEKQLASVTIMNKFMNASYLFGVANLKNYGITNDPNLSSALSPTTKTGGGTVWSGTQVTPVDILNDFQALYAQLQLQVNGIVDRQMEIVVAMAPVSEQYLTKTSIYNENVYDLLKKTFPNLTIVTIPEFVTGSGNLVQMMVRRSPEDGLPTLETAFTEKLRAHPMIVQLSSFKQKRSAGTWGAIFYRPLFVAQMLGV